MLHDTEMPDAENANVKLACTAESVDAGGRTQQDANQFLVLALRKTVLGPVVEKLRAAWVIKHRLGSLGYARGRLFDSAPQRLCHPINL
jgi:hypothetical protein